MLLLERADRADSDPFTKGGARERVEALLADPDDDDVDDDDEPSTSADLDAFFAMAEQRLR